MRGVAKEGHSPEEVEKAIYEQIDKLKQTPVSEYELQKVKNQEAATTFRRLQNNFFLMIQLAMYDVLSDWSYINTYPRKVQAVTAADIQRVAKKYFTKENRNVIIYTRKEGTAPEDPAIAALPDQAKQMVKMMVSRLKQVNQKDQLQQMISRLESGINQVPEKKKKKAMEIILKKARERLQELEKN